MVSKKNKNSPDEVKRGEIYTCDLGKDKIGSEQKKSRPVMIIQNNLGNKHSPTVIVAAISTQRINSGYPMHVDILKKITNLREDSTVLLEQIFTVDKQRLGDRIVDLSENKSVIKQLDKAIQVSLGLEVDKTSP